MSAQNADDRNPHAVALAQLRNRKLGRARIAEMCRIAREAKRAKREGAEQ